MRGLLGGVLAFAATTVVTMATSAQLSDWHEAPDLAPLRPTSAIEAVTSTAAPTTQTRTTRTKTTQTNVTIQLPDGDAEAILVEPQGGAEVGVVLVAGAGKADRHGLVALAQHFAAEGVAALTYDKRTDGYSLFHRDYDQLADDALTAVETMRAATGIERIGAWGISEGGWVLSSAAARGSSPLAFAVFVSAPVVTPLEQSGWIIDRALQETPELVRRAGATVVAQGRSSFDYLDFDARPLLASTRVPTLALWGAEDAIVPVNEAYRRMNADLGDHLLAYVVPDLGHDMAAVPAAWVPTAAAWMKTPAGAGLIGVNPTSGLGVSEPVATLWYASPQLHLAASSLIGGVVGFLVWRRSKNLPGRKKT